MRDCLRAETGLEISKKISLRVQEKEFKVQRLTLPDEKVHLCEKDLARHYREKAAVKKAFAASAAEKLWQEKFILPSNGRISTPFGVKRFINNEPRSPHSGIDFASPKGTPVPASSSGVVALTGDHFFSGKTVLLDHGLHIYSMYFHLSSISVKKGDSVSRGQIIGRVGSTGRSTAPHLHWGVRINGKRVSPLSFLELFEK